METVLHTLPTPSDKIIEHPARPIPFEIVENPPTLSEEVRPKGLLLHCGADIVERQDLFEVVTPKNTKTWFPIPHRNLLTEVETQLRETGFIIRATDCNAITTSQVPAVLKE